MANRQQILDKVARNLKQLGIASVRNANDVTLANGGNALVISYVDADIQKPMGGIDPTVNPFLGIGVANPGKIKIKSSTNLAGDIADVIDSDLAAIVLHQVSAFANSLILENSDASFQLEIQGHQDLLNMGQ